MAETVLSDAKKEQIKLRATFLNNTGIGIMLIGVFTPIVRAIYEPAAVSGNFLLVGTAVAIFFLAGVTLRFAGGVILRELSK